MEFDFCIKWDPTFKLDEEFPDYRFKTSLQGRQRKSAPKKDLSGTAQLKGQKIQRLEWRSGRDSNPRPPA